MPMKAPTLPQPGADGRLDAFQQPTPSWPSSRCDGRADELSPNRRSPPICGLTRGSIILTSPRRWTRGGGQQRDDSSPVFRDGLRTGHHAVLKESNTARRTGIPASGSSEQKPARLNCRMSTRWSAPGGAAVNLPVDLARRDGVLYFLLAPAAHRHGKNSTGGAAPQRRKDSRTYREISQIGEEIKLLAPELAAPRCWRTSASVHPRQRVGDATAHAAEQAFQPARARAVVLQRPAPPHVRRGFSPRPTRNLFQYNLVIAPSLHLMAGGEADLLKLTSKNGGTLVGNCNTGLVDRTSHWHRTPAIRTT